MSMTGLQRMGALASSQSPDCVPIIGNLLEQGARELGLSIEEYYSCGEHVAAGQLALQRRYGYDNVSAYLYAGAEAEMLGCQKMIFSDCGPPNVGHLILRELADIDALEIPDDVTDNPAFAKMAACARILRAEVGGQQFIGGGVVASFSLPALLMGIERWLDLLLNGPASARDMLLAKCSDFCTKLIHALRGLELDGIYYSNPVASADFLSVPQFEELALPWIKRDLEAVGVEGITYFNGGGRINPMLPTLLEESEIAVYYINPLDDVAEAKRLIGERGISSGVINDIRLLDWTPREIDTEVQRIMDAGKVGGRFFFGTLVMPYLIPEPNITALFEAARRHGRYT